MKEFSNEAYFLLFSTLANRTRLAIIDVLKDTAKTVSEISRVLEQDADVISQNLRPLVKCAIALSNGSAKEKRYCLNKELIEPLSDILSFHVEKYCPAFKECVSAEKLKQYMKAEAAKTTYIEHE